MGGVRADDEYTALDAEERAAWKQLRYAGIERRYNAFPSPAAMRERFSGRPPYTDWQPQCLDDYCAHGLLTLEELHDLAHRVDGGDDGSPEEAEEALVGDRGEAAGAMVLACLPRFERAWYEGSRAAGRGAGLLHDLHRVTVPVDIVRSSLDGTNPDGSVNFAGSPTEPDLWKRFANATDEIAPDLSHFIPMEDPLYAATRVRKMLAGIGSGGDSARL